MRKLKYLSAMESLVTLLENCINEFSGQSERDRTKGKLNEAGGYSLAGACYVPGFESREQILA